MTANPISANSLGIRNPHQQFGYTYTVIGGVVAIMTLMRFVGSLFAPIQPWEWPFLIVLLVYAGRRIYVGLRLMVHTFVDTLGPGPLEHSERTINELLEHKRIWTYSRPNGLVAELLHRFSPELNYLTPPFQSLRDGSVYQMVLAIVAVVALLATPYLGWGTLPLLLIAAVALSIRLMAVQSAVGELAGYQPPVDVYDGKEHLTEAGSPIDFFNNIRAATDSLQERGYRNRVIYQRPPEVGTNAHSNRCEADLVLETQPVPLEDQRATSRTVFLLDIGGAFLECFAVALLLLTFTGFTSVWTAALLMLSSLVAWDAGTRFRLLAQGLLCTFRFHSDLFWLHLDGSYVMNEVAVGGGANGFISTKGQAFRSDLFANVFGTRIVTECGLPLRGLGARVWGNSRAAEHVLQFFPRYVLSAQLDPPFQDRLQWLLVRLRTYRDQAENLRAPVLDSQRMSQLVSQNLTMAQMLGVATAQGTVLGQHQAMQTIGGIVPSAAPTLVSASGPVPSALPSGPPSATTLAPVWPPNNASPPVPVAAIVRWNCPGCGHQLKAGIEHSGKSAKCTKCGAPQTIPAGHA